jgi:hypothetical protein
VSRLSARDVLALQWRRLGSLLPLTNTTSGRNCFNDRKEQESGAFLGDGSMDMSENLVPECSTAVSDTATKQAENDQQWDQAAEPEP